LKGIIYVGHLPYGFVEDGIKKYFEQYGEITGVKLARSKKVMRHLKNLTLSRLEGAKDMHLSNSNLKK